MSMTAIFFIVFIITMFIGVPIGFSIGMGCVLAIALGGDGLSVAVIATRTINCLQSPAFLAVPFFILCGDIMSRGGLSKRLINLCKCAVGWIPGGLGHVASVASAFFAALSGSNVATTAAIGGIMIPELEKNDYDRDLSAALVAASGTTGIVIPPSTPAVIYASVSGASLISVFMGGILPGIGMCVACMIVTFIIAKRSHIPGQPWAGFMNLLKTFVKAIGALFMPIIIIGGIYGGICTPTESAVLACIYSFVVCLCFYKEFKLKDILGLFERSAMSTATGMMVVVFANALSYILTYEQIPAKLAQFVLSITDSPILLLLLIDVMLLIAGCFLSATPIILIVTPILLPVVKQLGISPVAFGVIMIVNLAIGCITPPVGSNLFIAQSVANVPIIKIFKRVMPYLCVLIIVLVLITIFPQIVTFVPELMGLSV